MNGKLFIASRALIFVPQKHEKTTAENPIWTKSK